MAREEGSREPQSLVLRLSCTGCRQGFLPLSRILTKDISRDAIGDSEGGLFHPVSHEMRVALGRLHLRMT